MSVKLAIFPDISGKYAFLSVKSVIFTDENSTKTLFNLYRVLIKEKPILVDIEKRLSEIQDSIGTLGRMPTAGI